MDFYYSDFKVKAYSMFTLLEKYMTDSQARCSSVCEKVYFPISYLKVNHIPLYFDDDATTETSHMLIYRSISLRTVNFELV